MSDNEEPTESSGEDRNPFADEAPPVVQYVIDEWGDFEDDLVIRGNVKSMSVTFELKRPKFQSDNIYGHEEVGFDRFKCDIVVPKAKAEIMATGDDVGIVGYVFERLAQELGVQMRQVSLYHMHKAYPEAEEGGTRVEAGERRDTAKEKSVEF